MTGLSEGMRGNFGLMKDLAMITNADAPKRLEECRSLLETFKLNDRCRQEMEQWQVEIAEEPYAVEGCRLPAGALIMGKTPSGNRVEVDLESSTQDIDRKIQNQMYEQPELNKWGIFYADFDKKNALIFMETMQKCCEQFRYSAQKPREFAIRGGQRFSDWEDALLSNLNNQVQAIVLILPG